MALTPVIQTDKKSGEYLIGTKKHELLARGKDCMVRVGGGYVTIEEHLGRAARVQASSLDYYKQMSGKTKAPMSFLQAIEHWVGQPRASKAFMRKLKKDKTGVHNQ